MRIDGLGALLPRLLVSAVQKVAATGAGVTDMGAQQSVPPHGDIANPTIGSVQMLVAMSATTPAAERKQKAARAAAKGLDSLDKLQRALAIGRTEALPIEALRLWAEQREPSGDPELEALIDQIDLRVRVEIAKLDRSI